MPPTHILDLNKTAPSITHERILEIVNRAETAIATTQSRLAVSRIVENAIREALMEVGAVTR